MTDNPIINFGIIFVGLLVIVGIPLFGVAIRDYFKKRYFCRELGGKKCPLCGCEFGYTINPFHPPYDEWTPRKERTYDHWLFYCGNCQGDIWIDKDAKIVLADSPNKSDFQENNDVLDDLSPLP